MGAFAFVTNAIFRTLRHQWSYLYVLEALAVFTALTTQAVFLFPYTPFAAKMSRDAKPRQNQTHDHDISVIVANVLYENTRYEVLLEDIRKHDPDVLVFDEVDEVWLENLQPVTSAYPYRVEVPQNNCYGIALYSKLKMRDVQIRHLVERNVPSIFSVVTLRSGIDVSLICVHPEPASPTGNDVSTERDAELMLVAKHVRSLKGPVIVAGDLNDVAWCVSPLKKQISLSHTFGCPGLEPHRCSCV
jgi:endonuclease/exonuclease/phosphatase (EEP) superfamily protein YafD